MLSKLSELLAELKRRRVYRVAVAYVVLGAGIIGLGEAAIPSWDQIQLPTVILVLLGFPIALILAWAYELKPEEPRAPAKQSSLAVRRSVVPDDASIVVLPFDNLSPDPDDAYFSDGLTEEIIADLSCLRSLRVISRTSSMLMKGSGKDVRTIGQELAVRYVLEGSVRKAGERLRVTAQLIDAGVDQHIWSERYDGELGDVFSIQESVARSIASALQVEMTPEEDRGLSTTSVPDVATYECVLRARHEVWTGTAESVNKAIAYLESAQEVVGENVAILSTLAEARLMLSHATGAGMQDLAGWLNEVADRILSLDPAAASGYFNKALAATKRPWGGGEAMRHFRRATELDPTDTVALAFRGYWAAATGCVDEALGVSSQMLSLDPLSPLGYLNRAWCLMFAGDLDEAIALAERGFKMDPSSTYWRWSLAIVMAQSGKRKEVAELAEPVAESPKDNWALATALLGAALTSRPAEEFLTPQFLSTAADDETFSLMLAQCYAQMRDADEAMRWLENTISHGIVNAEFLGTRDILLEPLRADPRFGDLMAIAREQSERLQLSPGDY